MNPIIIEDHLFVLHTQDTTYAFRVIETGHLEHLYYGQRLHATEGLVAALGLKSSYVPGNTIAYHASAPSLSLEALPQEVSTTGKGDCREAFVITQDALGRRTSDFVFKTYTRHQGLGPNPVLGDNEALPLPHDGARAPFDEGVETLCIFLEDRVQGTTLCLTYTVFYRANVIGKRATLINTSDKSIRVERLMSNQLDLSHHAYELIHFGGAWAREMDQHRTPLSRYEQLGSQTGTSSNRCNPFFMLKAPRANEDFGDCYGFNLIYSGNWISTLEVDAFGSTRVLQGVRPDTLSKALKPEAVIETPMAIMTYSATGLTNLSHQMHRFVQHHIVRGQWQYRVRPVLINSWEAFYFNVQDKKLLRLARRAKALGVELFVLDDGWFGDRDSDTRGLGDWQENLKKLPRGLEGLAKDIHALGMDFGLWLEPEMVNEDSKLYRQHPDWVLRIPNVDHSLGRNQLLLNLGLKEVTDYLYEVLADILEKAPINYIKWDMNRIVSDVYSPALEPSIEGQQALMHRYVLGLYHLLDRLTRRFPQVLFEGCASGGNRFDLGMLCYMPQIWASDNTDAHARVAIQKHYSYGYPLSTLGAHVSDVPNHQTLREAPLALRQTVASFGLLGYEMNLLTLDGTALKAIGDHIDFYKTYRQVLQFGDFYRLNPEENPELEGSQAFMVVDSEKKRGVLGLMQGLTTANRPQLRLKLKGISETTTYRLYNRHQQYSLRVFGDLVNAVSPIPLPKGSLRFKVAEQLYPIAGETFDLVAQGSILMGGGVRLPQAFIGMGYKDSVRLYQDFASRLYCVEARQIDEGL